jgi:ATP-binding cassette subfamily G (WHITE) protein 2 (PDR)
MLEVIGAAPGSHTDLDWPEIWRNSPERQEVKKELQKIKERKNEITETTGHVEDKASYREFAAPLTVQMREVLQRVFQQYWRTPSYIYSKTALCVLSISRFTTLLVIWQRLMNVLIGTFHWVQFLSSTKQSTRSPKPNVRCIRVDSSLCQSSGANYAAFRYPTRSLRSPRTSFEDLLLEAFVISNIIVELPWNSLMAVLVFFVGIIPLGCTAVQYQQTRYLSAAS